MSRGLNRAQREIIRSMVEDSADGQEVRKQIYEIARSEGYDYNKNLSFCGELVNRGYVETAKYLEKLINDRGVASDGRI